MRNINLVEKLVPLGMLLGMAWLIVIAVSLVLFSGLYMFALSTVKDYNLLILFSGEFWFRVLNFPAGFLGNLLGIAALVLIREGATFLPWRAAWQTTIAHLFFVSFAISVILGMDYNSGTPEELLLDVVILSVVFALYGAGRQRLLSGWGMDPGVLQSA